MDFNSLKDQISNLTMYDVKAGVRKVQNAMMNYTEMEAKVREATNNEPWGASSTLMQEIANGTHSYQLLNEIMPMIYRRFTEKTAEEWRQIYKALQLLEFLIKNGSERVVDDARSHISLLRMLRQFHYIDNNGKDQGVNVRNRAQELAKLLGDVDAIRAERKKAKANRNKFGGIEGGMGGFSGGFSGNSRYGGFGSDDASFGGYSGGVYGDGGGFGGNTSGFNDPGRRSNRFEEYDENEDDGSYSTSQRRTERSTQPASRQETKKPEPPKAPEPDLVDFGDMDEPAPSAPSISQQKSSVSAGKKPAGNNGLADLASQPIEDDDFDEFQSGSPTTQATAPQSQFASLPPPTATSTMPSQTQFAAPKPVSGTQGANLNGLMGLTSMPPTPSVSSSASHTPNMTSPNMNPQPLKPMGYQAVQPNYFTSVPVPQAQQSQSSIKTPSGGSSFASSKPAPAAAAKASGDVFGSLWSSASANAGIKSTAATQNKGPNLASMAKEKASAGIWGTPAGTMSATSNTTGSTAMSASQQQQKPGNTPFGHGLDDLLG
ncbi:Epsin-3, clathrin recruitment and traffic between the Golgi and endosome [Coccidioides posadasii str. Silveira]|uniref:Golgi to endosome transporter n=1 Tax=Coccidioides posadasii (strain RMSCC 757 / Silveira) TaxID=443226 RepID=E9D932_COCPS|nr:golgi to endosome transporter [Coccidioides posadasii str. Silveira]QVM09173.1 Epsin-3, clathrin recruitment and traffic between the Golgi and endosome [Coccidioides posadasii str. Silveira]